MLPLVLAAGKGKRMHSDLPKVLQPILDKPMLWYLLTTLEDIFSAQALVVVGHGAQQVQSYLGLLDKDVVYQDKQMGTGHALQVALPRIQGHGINWLLVLNGDTPFVPAGHIQDLVQHVRTQNHDMGFISLSLTDPGSYGRVLRGPEGEVQAIIEARDFDPAQHGGFVHEVNSGLYVFNINSLEKILYQLDTSNQQQELYITQLVSLAHENRMWVDAFNAGDCPELLGINTPAELLQQEELKRRELINKLISQGVFIRGKDNVRIGPEVDIEPGAEIVGPTEIYGQTRITAGSKINSHCYIQDSFVDRAEVLSFSHIVKSDIEKYTKIGPYARLRPGTLMKNKSKAGNFVEIKNSTIGPGSKVNHLAYIGDTWIGESVNVGAGTITCNYDGRKKHETYIEDQVFIGSNTSLVAPVRLEQGALVGAGSVITKDVPRQSLGIARAKQKNLEGKSPLNIDKTDVQSEQDGFNSKAGGKS